VWVAAAAGILCGLGAWRVAIIVTLLVGLVLLVGGPIEKLLIDYSGSVEEGSTSLPDKEPPSAF
jgi:uncharacterized membrane protein YhiD involved in acid resistance